MSKRDIVTWMLTTYPLWGSDGYAARVNGELHALRRQATKVGVIAIIPLVPWRDSARATWKKGMETLGVPVREIPNVPDRGFTLARQVADRVLCRQVAGEAADLGAQVIHAQGIRAASLARLLRPTTRLVVDVHGDIESEAWTELGHRSPYAAWAQADTKFALRRGDAFIVVSENMGDWLRKKLSGSPREILTVP